MSTRRTFLKQSVLGICALSVPNIFWSCHNDELAHIKGRITGANSKTGHLLRNSASLPEPVQELNTDILIVGGGVSGLSARRWLSKHSALKVVLLEMDEHCGGNARYGKNAVSEYPYGAHYLPVPDIRNIELIEFLQSCESITGQDEKGLPIYNEYHLCQDPEERLFINGMWQEGIVPELGVTADDRNQIQRFFQEIQKLKLMKGKDGKDLFRIPIQDSSDDPEFASLDAVSFSDFLKEQNYTSRPLLWYLEYCCKDDYGATLNDVSAFAGLHYFASRKGQGNNVTHASTLTWPEGNGFLSDALKADSRGDTLSNQLVFDLRRSEDFVLVKSYNPKTKKSTRIKANKVILATPVSVNKRLLKNERAYDEIITGHFQRAPWAIVNLTVDSLPQGKGMPLCWDNVLFGTNSVGYVNASHQSLDTSNQRVITFYLPITGADTSKARQEASSKDFRFWLRSAIDELKVAHPGIEKHISNADVWIWGHGMIRPSPGFITSKQRKIAAQSIDDALFFAHTDLSGISIFEEAFYQGIRAAKEVLRSS